MVSSILAGGTRSIGGFARTDRAFTDDEMVDLHAIMTCLHDMTSSKTTLSADDLALLEDLSRVATRHVARHVVPAVTARIRAQ